MCDLSQRKLLQIIFLFAHSPFPLQAFFRSEATLNIQQVLCYFQVLLLTCTEKVFALGFQ